MTCILCDKPLKTLRKITWQKEVCGNPKCEYYNVGSPEPMLMLAGMSTDRFSFYMYQCGTLSNAGDL